MNEPATLEVVTPKPPKGLDLLRTVKKGFETVAEVVAASSGISIYDWKDMARSLIENQEKLQWAWGLWWNCGKFEHGERKRIVEAEDWNGPSYQTLKNYGNVAKRFLLDGTAGRTYRYYRYPFSYYEKLAPLDEVDVNMVLGEAFYTSRTQLEAAIARRTEQGKLPLTSDPVTTPDSPANLQGGSNGEAKESSQSLRPSRADETPTTPTEQSHCNAIDDVKQRLQERYQTEVGIHGGRITIRYYNDADLSRIVSLMGISENLDLGKSTGRKVKLTADIPLIEVGGNQPY